jgi:hypothetical protein
MRNICATKSVWEGFATLSVHVRIASISSIDRMDSLLNDIQLVSIPRHLIAMALDELAGGLVIVLADLLWPVTRTVDVAFDVVSLEPVLWLVSAEHVIMTRKIICMWSP